MQVCVVEIAPQPRHSGNGNALGRFPRMVAAIANVNRSSTDERILERHPHGNRQRVRRQRRWQRRERRGALDRARRLEIELVNPEDFMTWTPLRMRPSTSTTKRTTVSPCSSRKASRLGNCRKLLTRRVISRMYRS